MPVPVVLALLATLSAAPADTGMHPLPDTTTGPTMAGLSAGVTTLAEDTVPRRRRKSVEVSEWYGRRLAIHRVGSYLVYPLFVAQAVAGNQIYQESNAAPDWAKTTHRVGATGLAAVFTVNTVTGLWNLWDSRAVEQGRTRRTLHALFMLASDAGFTYAGARLSEQAETSADKRSEHRKWAYGSMATSLAGIAIAKFWPED
jgi:hypothetical protein